MTDRELLEMAAKAAGIEYQRTDEGEVIEYFGGGLQLTFNRGKWNPLTNDGDALRLAIALKLDILWAEHENSVVACNDSSNDEPICEKVRFISEAGPATRRAIVRAAAEIGKEKP